jgi:CBS domain-containing protein
MKVRDFLCSSRIQFFKINDTVRDACAIFNDLKIDASVVVDDNDTLVGLFKKNHVFKAIKNGTNLDTPIGELMTRNVMSGHPDDNVEDRFYFKHGYLPVVENGKAVGVISIPDFVKTYHDSYKVARNFVDAIVNPQVTCWFRLVRTAELSCNRMAQERLEMGESDLIGKDYSLVFRTLDLWKL